MLAATVLCSASGVPPKTSTKRNVDAADQHGVISAFSRSPTRLAHYASEEQAGIGA
jgi:hypothetical protein